MSLYASLSPVFFDKSFCYYHTKINYLCKTVI